MLTPETQPTKERIEFWRDFFHHFLKAERHAEIDALCDMALAHLEAAPSGEGARLRELWTALDTLDSAVQDVLGEPENDGMKWHNRLDVAHRLTNPKLIPEPSALAARPLEAAKQGEPCENCDQGHARYRPGFDVDLCDKCTAELSTRPPQAQPPASQGGNSPEIPDSSEQGGGTKDAELDSIRRSHRVYGGPKNEVKRAALKCAACEFGNNGVFMVGLRHTCGAKPDEGDL